jgi:hypothetical protein
MRNGFRIVMWASAGFLVSVCWGFYFAAANKSVPIEPIVYALAYLTQPFAGVVLYLDPHYALGLRAVVVANAATYALIGIVKERIPKRTISQASMPF